MKKGSLHRLWLAASLSLLLGFSFGWVWHVGHRGLFLLDQSIAFDGAWRIAQGQVPYRDFYMPFGPVAFLLPALFFHLSGPTFSALVAAASVLSLLGTAVAVRLCWRLTGSHGLALLGGALTAVWLQAPFGVPWMEQTAFFFDLVALACLVEHRLAPRAPPTLAVAAGVASALAVLSKQNAGGIFLLVGAGALLVPLRGRGREALRGLLAYALGGVATALAFAIWVQSYANFSSFWHYWVEVSSETGLARVESWKLMGTAFFQTVVSSSVPLFCFTTLVGAVALSWLLRRGRARQEGDDALAVCAFLALALPQFHNAFQLTTNNDVGNNNAFVGVCLVSALSLAGSARRYVIGRSEGELALAARHLAAGWPWRVGAWALLGCVAYSFGDGLLTARERNVQELFGARFERRLEVVGAERVWWGEPTRITPNFCGNLGDMCKLDEAVALAERPQQILQRADFERLARELREGHENFFVFPDATMLYGLSGRPSPQPLLYFHPGQSFLSADRPELDERIVESLKRHRVTRVVLERVSFMGTSRELAAFPKLKAWIDAEFEPQLELGNYRVLRARGSPAVAAAAR